MAAITVHRAFSFWVYREAKYSIDKVIERATGDSPLEWVNTPGTYPNLSTLACFTTAGIIQGAALTPFLSKLVPVDLTLRSLTL